MFINTLIFTVVFFVTITSTAAVQGREYLLATASTGGTFYPVGVALTTLTKVWLKPTHGIGIQAINTAGSDERT